jgi:hypothetical protein
VVYEGHLNHSAEVHRPLLDSREQAARFFPPSNEALDDVSPAVLLTVEIRIRFIISPCALLWDHGLDVTIG